MIINLKMDSIVLSQQSNHGIMDDEKKGVDNDAVSSDVSSVVSSEDSDLFEEVNSSSASSTDPTSPTSASGSASSSSDQLRPGDFEPLQDMSSLLQELPFKRGLSKHYNGKSQSFTSLATVACLEDLAKPENPYNKKLKSCKSYGGLMFEGHHHGSPSHPNAGRNTHSSSTTSARLMSKKASRGSCSSLCVKRNSSFIVNRPPIPPPHRSTSTSNFTPQTPLFALGV